MIAELRKTGNLEEYRYKINEIIKYLNNYPLEGFVFTENLENKIRETISANVGVTKKIGIDDVVVAGEAQMEIVGTIEEAPQLELPLNTTKKVGRPKKQ
jgi:hypothetical protein